MNERVGYEMWGGPADGLVVEIDPRRPPPFFYLRVPLSACKVPMVYSKDAGPGRVAVYERNPERGRYEFRGERDE